MRRAESEDSNERHFGVAWPERARGGADGSGRHAAVPAISCAAGGSAPFVAGAAREIADAADCRIALARGVFRRLLAASRWLAANRRRNTGIAHCDKPWRRGGVGAARCAQCEAT